jgi:8-amino-7-oxononanoate synthase
MRTSESLEARVRARVNALREAGLLRTLRSPDGVDFSSNDYLGLSNHPLLKERMIEAVQREGCGSTGSRLLRGQRESFAAVERTFAALKETERALYFSSGYLANIAVLTTFPEEGDVILSDEHNHASLIDGIRLSGARRVVFPHNNVEALINLVARHRGSGQMFVVAESLFSMDGDMAPLVEYAALCRSVGALLIVDEAHAVGVYGARGSGLIEAQGIAQDVFVSINTAGKALGVSGAFVAGPSWAIEYLIQRARPFIFSTAPPPPLAAALEASLASVAREPERRERLMHLARDLRAQLSEAGIAVPPGSSQIIPVMLGDNDRASVVAQALQAQGFDVRAIRPPSVAPGTARLRITVNVGLDEATISRFVVALAGAVRESARCSAVFS